MSENIFSTSDDDIFEDYVESSSSSYQEQNSSNDSPSLDKIFADVDSPFKKLLQNSSLKVGLGEAFYAAADEWVNAGYKEANASAIVKELAELTEGRFLYKHRLECCKEVIARKKTIIRFVNILLDSEQEKNLISSASDSLKINLSETYFDVFFKSYYNIEMFMLQHEIALYKSLCDIMQIEVDSSLLDLNVETEVISNTADVINDLYIQYFDKDNLEERMNQYVKEFRSKKED
jgi:hypothetical protein